MSRSLLGAAAALMLAGAASPALADFSACESAYVSRDLHQQIDLYTLCLKTGGLMQTDVAGAFTNRGVAYSRLGETDKALADFTAAIQYDPNWPTAYVDRALIEAERQQCPQALADLKAALKLAPHKQSILEFRNQLLQRCPADAATTH